MNDQHGDQHAEADRAKHYHRELEAKQPVRNIVAELAAVRLEALDARLEAINPIGRIAVALH